MIAFAPLQGYTDAVYRRAHHEVAGGVDEYYTPFVRWDGEGLRPKDRRDVDPARNAGVPTVPQVIARDRDEFARLCDALQAMGWGRIDLNMGCPFPMQVRAGRGCGLLQHPDNVEAIAGEMLRRPEVTFSVKMRLGQETEAEGLWLLPILNAMPLAHITLHPRLGRQQYKGTPDLEAFARFYEACSHPMLYNGDITSCREVDDLQERFPGLKGVMIGRGLLASPWLFSDEDLWQVIHNMHERVYRHVCETLQGESQMLPHLHAFWEYQTGLIYEKEHKAIMKSTTLRRYNAAVANLWRQH